MSALADLSQCRTQVAEPFKIREPFRLGWGGGGVQAGREEQVVPRRTSEHCSHRGRAGQGRGTTLSARSEWSLGQSHCPGFWTKAGCGLCHCLLCVV